MKGIPIQPVTTLRRRSRHLLKEIPTDLVGVAGFVVVATVLLTVVDISSPVLRAAVGVPLLFLVPGYVTVSMLFPRAEPITDPELVESSFIAQQRELTDVERVALSFGLSMAILPLLGLVISITAAGFTESTVVGTVSGFALAGLGVATGRRLAVPAPDRYRIHLGRRIATVRSALFDTDSTLQLAVNIALAVSLLVAVTTVGYALAAPQDGEEYTSLQLLTETESGDLVAGGYPDEVEPGESIPLVIGVENQEQEAMNYTVVVQEERIEAGEVVDRTQLRVIDYSLSDGGVGYGERELTPTETPGDVRITVLVYTDEVPETPSTENAYRHAYFWTEITDGDGDGEKP